MMKNPALLYKTLVIGIIFLLIGICVVPSISGNIEMYNENLSISGNEKSSSTTDWWSQHQHDPQNTGYSDSVAPNTNNVLWTYRAEKCRAVLSRPVIVDGRVYIGGAGEDLGLIGDKDFGGKLYCLDATTGNVLWLKDYPLEGDLHNQIVATPVIDDGRIFVCPTSMDNWIGEVHCYNASNGNLLWETKNIGDTSLHPPMVFNGKLYLAAMVGRHESKIYCLNTTSGEILWSYSAEGLIRCPAFADGKIYIGRRGLDNDYNVCCLNASSGDMLWFWINPLEHGCLCSPIVIDGKVFIGSEGHGKGHPNGDVWWIPGAMFCLDALTGAMIWQSDVRQDFKVDFSIFDGRIYAGSSLYIGQSYFMIYCFDCNSGDVIWENKIANLPGLLFTSGYPSSTIVADGKVFVCFPCRFECKFSCFDALTGENIWTYSVPGWLPVCYGPAVADGQLYFPFSTMNSRDGTLYCFSDIDSDAPDAPSISGPKRGSPGVEYEYTIVTTDPNSDDVYYYINWDDGTSEKWIGPFSSGEEVTVNHTWTKKCKYEIRARAKDTDGLRGAIGSLKATMSRTRVYNLGYHWFLERFPMLGRLLNLLR